ncbi:hypothetical protein ACLOJK_024468 [Asimina triloba]
MSVEAKRVGFAALCVEILSHHQLLSYVSTPDHRRKRAPLASSLSSPRDGGSYIRGFDGARVIGTYTRECEWNCVGKLEKKKSIRRGNATRMHDSGGVRRLGSVLGGDWSTCKK